METLPYDIWVAIINGILPTYLSYFRLQTLKLGLLDLGLHD